MAFPEIHDKRDQCSAKRRDAIGSHRINSRPDDETHCRQCDQATATGDGIDETRKKPDND
jgi:hypothetical protein